MGVDKPPTLGYIYSMKGIKAMQITTQLATYTIKEEVRTRMAGGILEGCDLYEKTYTQYNILKDDQLVAFVFDQNDVNQAIHDMETAAWKGVGCRFD